MADSTLQTNDIDMSTIATLVKDLLIAEMTGAKNTSTPAWLDRLPTEVRLEIFKLAQQHKGVLLVVNELNKDATVDVSLLVALVNDKKSVEAVEAFYTTNTLRLTTYAQLASPNLGLADGAGDAFHFITSLELRNWAVFDEFMSADGQELLARICGQMPRLKHVVVAIDSVAGKMSIDQAILPVDGYKLDCVDVGKYRMTKTEGVTVDFVHCGLVEAWQGMLNSKPEVFREQAEAFDRAVTTFTDGVITAQVVITGHVEFFLNISLARWAAVWGTGVKLIMSPEHADGPPKDLTPEEFMLLQVYGKSVRYCRTAAAAKVYQAIVSAEQLRDLADSLPSSRPEMLEGITDIQRLNSSSSPFLVSGGPKYWRERAWNKEKTVPLAQDGEIGGGGRLTVKALVQMGLDRQ
ncbi:hypothetical protein LTR15_012715 [Elasticomyces elasticus]|nr:hypothetical protein LTR15_012715 [Elasticomyces elasticus]